MSSYDIAIIGGGIVGCALARQLSRYSPRVAVFEKGPDVSSGTSKANSGVIHSGINSRPGTLKAQFCVQGNTLFSSLANELGFHLRWVGKYVIAKNDKERKELERLQQVGQRNGVNGLEIHEKELIAKKEPNVTCEAGLWVPTAGIVLPYEVTIALAENAAKNGVHFHLLTTVTGIKKRQNFFSIKTPKKEFSAKVVINAAGINCNDIYSMVESSEFTIYPCRGEYLILDKIYHSLLKSMIYPVPDRELGVLGVHITPTIEGNIILGPSAEYINKLADTRTTHHTMKLLLKEAQDIIPSLPHKGTIAAYAGVRCKIASPEEGGMADFQIIESPEYQGMIHLLGIESPGLTAAPALANHVVDLISHDVPLKPNDQFQPCQPKKTRFADMSPSQQHDLIKQDKRWGRVICRCEHVTEAEVLQALHNPLGAHSISAVKYRCRAGMGRCQGGFCTQHIIRLMQEELGLDVADIILKSEKSNMFTGKTREIHS